MGRAWQHRMAQRTFTKRLLSLGLAIFLAFPLAGQEKIPNPFEMLPETSDSTASSSEADADAAKGVEDAPDDSLVAPKPSASQQASGSEVANDLEFDVPVSGDGEPKADSGSNEANAEALQDDAIPAEKNGVPSDVEVADDPSLEFADEEPVDVVLEKQFKHALVIQVEGPIFSRFHWYVQQRLQKAEREGVDLVVLAMTTPGGDLEYSIDLARTLRGIDWATTVVWIPEEAISGGAIISLGADRIFMQEGALIGDAGPISMNLGGQFEHAPEKVVSYLASVMRELAEAGGRPGALAEAMVDRNLVVYEAIEKTTNKIVYLTQAEVDQPETEELFVVGPEVSEAGQNRFLTVAAKRAVELGLSEGEFQSESELIGALTIDRIERTEFTWKDRCVFLLNSRWISALLLVGGLVGLYIEFAAPGISVAGLTALLCFGLFFWSHVLGGTAGWLEVMLFGLGIICLACELFVLPGFGVFGVTGLLLVVLSLVMASQDFVIPEGVSQWAQFRSNLFVVLGAVCGVLVLLFVQVMLLDSLPGLNRVRLHAPGQGAEVVVDGATASITSLTGGSTASERSFAVGMEGVADSDLRPSGKVQIENHLIDVVTEGDYVDVGAAVRILRIEGNRIVVRKVTES